jgi:hypothetical protein
MIVVVPLPFECVFPIPSMATVEIKPVEPVIAPEMAPERSWIAPELQQAILRFLNGHLKPGGLLYVSYNAMPSWASVGPLQRVVKELAVLWPGRSDRAAENAIKMLSNMAEVKIIPPNLHEDVKRITDKRLNSSYLAHEYLNEHWRPLYHADAVRAFAEAKLAFAGSTQLLRNFTNLGVTKEQQALLSEVPIPELRETLRDFCIGHAFRQDVYVRGARRMTEGRRDAYLGAQTLALLQPPPGEIEISGPGGTWHPNPEAYRIFLDALAKRPHTIAQLLSLPDLPPGHNVSSVELTGVLGGPFLVAPFREADANVRSRCERLNLLFAPPEEELDVSKSVTLVAPSVRTALKLPPATFDLYKVLKRGETPDPSVLAKRFVKRCFDEGGHPIIEGKAFEEESEALTATQADFKKKIDRLVPVWRMIGLI